MGRITEIIVGGADNGGAALELLWPAAYAELKQLARSRLQRSPDLTLLDTTALVNESYLRLVSSGHVRLNVVSSRHFFAYASRVMRSVIVDMVRGSGAESRGHGESLGDLPVDAGRHPAADDPETIHEALRSLENLEPRLAMIVQMRYFGGMTDAEIALALKLGERTVRRDWEKARMLLREMLKH